MPVNRSPGLIVCSAILALVFATTAHAQSTKPAGVTGTWKWTTEGFGGQQETVLKLKQDGDKITGTISGIGGEDSPISDAKLANGELTFKVVRDFGGRNFTTLYTGTVSGDSFKGKSQAIFEQTFDAKKSDK